MRLVQYGATVLPEPDTRGTISTNIRNTLLPLRYGGYDSQGDSALLIPNTFSVRYRNYDAIQATVDAVLQEIQKGRLVLVARERDGTGRQTFAKASAHSRPIEVIRFDNEQQVDITFVQDYPFWMASADEPEYPDTGLVFDGSWVLDGNFEEEDITTISHAFTITNDGNTRIPRGTLIIEPESGATIEKPKIVNTQNGRELEYLLTLGDTDSLAIDFLSETVELNGAGAYADFTRPDSQMDFMWLELDDNPIEVTAASIAGTVKLYWLWSRHYL